MSPSYSGDGSKLTLTPGQDVYFRTRAQGVNPASDILHLVVASRPSGPSYTVDYALGKTGQVVNTDVEYSASSDFITSTSGDGSKLTLTPGQNLYFRKKATTSSFASASFLLNIPPRPAAPSATVDFIHETTVE